MKKPKITEGEWKVLKIENKGMSTLRSETGKHIATVYRKFNSNAQAISAVPDMIKEGINSTRLLKILLEDDAVNLGAMRDEVRMQITANKRSLKKAGCE